MRDRDAKGQEKAAQAAGQEAAQVVADRTGVGIPKGDPDELRRDIEQTREQLGDTVEALAHKADVKSRLSEKLDGGKAAVRERQEQLRGKVVEARDRVADASPDDAGRAASRVAHTVTERPLPAVALALAIGLALGWMIKRS
jgi:ElaB/YqjD/DUF883 family membrane-anchored ribosome-binding protein